MGPIVALLYRAGIADKICCYSNDLLNKIIKEIYVQLEKLMSESNLKDIEEEHYLGKVSQEKNIGI